jgi:hypothetical protein
MTLDLSPPGGEEVQRIADGVGATLADESGRITEMQETVLTATFSSMTGHAPRFDPDRFDTAQLLDALEHRNLAFRQRIVQQLVLGALLVRPVPATSIERIRTVSRQLGIDEATIDLARELADGQFDLAAMDFDRNGYNADFDPARAAVFHASSAPSTPWQDVGIDPTLAARWTSLEDLPEGSLGLAVSRFYRARGFHYPGTPGSVSPQLAQHDWVHVLADYGATVDNEIEVFAFIARANDDPRGFSFLAMVVSLFETGLLTSGVGIFVPDSGHLRERGMPERLADAMRRGATCYGSHDFLGLDWFSIADQPIDAVRNEFGLVPKSPTVQSPGPFEEGGMTVFQLDAGRAAAELRGKPYETWGATPSP